jgi:hypothetical protein
MLGSFGLNDTHHGAFHWCTSVQLTMRTTINDKPNKINPRDESVRFEPGMQFTTKTAGTTWNFRVWAVGILTPSKSNVYRVLLVQRKRDGKTPFSYAHDPMLVLNAKDAPRKGFLTWDAPFTITPMEQIGVNEYLNTTKHGEPNRKNSKTLLASLPTNVTVVSDSSDEDNEGDEGDEGDEGEDSSTAEPTRSAGRGSKRPRGAKVAPTEEQNVLTATMNSIKEQMDSLRNQQKEIAAEEVRRRDRNESNAVRHHELQERGYQKQLSEQLKV